MWYQPALHHRPVALLARKRLNSAAAPALPGLVFAALLLAGCAAPSSPRPRPIPPAPPSETAPEAPPAPASAGPGAASPTLALLRQSERSADGGDLGSAIAYVERAIRLDPRDGALWLRLGRLQLAAGRPDAAEQMAQKAIALAADRRAERDGWLLVADAREARGDAEAAAEIRARWRTLRG